MELQPHFTHPQHPLILQDAKVNHGADDGVICSMCEEEVMGQCYTCEHCNFILHKECVSLPPTIQHPLHHIHPLTLLTSSPYDGKRFRCDFCRETGERFHYHCTPCKFDLHIRCATRLACLLNLESHRNDIIPEYFGFREHSFTYSEVKEGDGGQQIICFVCKRAIVGESTSCSGCNYSIHKTCAPPQAHPFVIKHPSHRKHPLFLTTDFEATCALCLKQYKFIYHCRFCDYYLDMGCAKLAPCFLDPQVEEHRFYGFKGSSMRSFSFTCDACGTKSDGAREAPYLCTVCHITVHSECRSLPRTIKVQHHSQHILTHTYWLQAEEELEEAEEVQEEQKADKEEEEDESKTEDQGDKEEDEISTEDQRDKEEEKEESSTKDRGDKEEEESSSKDRGEKEEEEKDSKNEEDEEDYSGNCLCGICHGKINLHRGGYRCSPCKFVAHAKCCQKFQLPLDWESNGALFGIGEGDTLEPSFSIVHEIQDGDTKIVAEMKHLSHVHNLIRLTTYECLANNQKCYGCMLPILSDSASPPPYYGCPDQECDFFLHQACTELPRRIQIPLDGAICQLSLQPKAETVTGIFRCFGCRNFCEGFACEHPDYRFAYCCIRCVNLVSAGNIKHEGHKHAHGSDDAIFISSEGFNGTRCNSCGFPIYGKQYFKCAACNFHLDSGCAALPLKTRLPNNKYDDHDLLLTCHPLDSDSYQSYCLICEEERDPNVWFYYCAKCDFAAHRDCALGEYPYIKSGSSYWRNDAHSHPLTIARKGSQRRCSECSDTCEYLAFECTHPECDFIIDWYCFK